MSSKREREVYILYLIQYFGDKLSYDDYACLLNISKERVRQLVKRLLAEEKIIRVQWKKGYRISEKGKAAFVLFLTERELKNDLNKKLKWK